MPTSSLLPKSIMQVMQMLHIIDAIQSGVLLRLTKRTMSLMYQQRVVRLSRALFPHLAPFGGLSRRPFDFLGTYKAGHAMSLHDTYT